MIDAPSEQEFRDEKQHFENRRIPRRAKEGIACHEILFLEEILVPTEVSVDELFSSVSNDNSGENQHSEHYSTMNHNQGRKNERILLDSV